MRISFYLVVFTLVLLILAYFQFTAIVDCSKMYSANYCVSKILFKE